MPGCDLPAPSSMCRFAINVLLVWCCGVGLPFLAEASPDSVTHERGVTQAWTRLLDDAERLRLPTKFLKAIPPDFIHFEFDDLRTYAAEYHPGDHRMILNRSLSFNAAGRMLKPLGKMTHKELEVLYHELFHAYMDYLSVREEQSREAARRSPEELLRFAREQQACRYGEVMIVPIVQRQEQMESRYLTQTESWEALNETWAVFIGWMVWNQLELQRTTRQSMVPDLRQVGQWVQRFRTALERGDLRGYYVPEDPDERRLVQKRYLAKPSQLAWKEARVLMKQVLGFQHDFIERVGASVKVFDASSCDAAEER